MADLARCNFLECKKKDNCSRFRLNDIYEYNIKSVCNEENGYDLLIENGKEIIPVVEKETDFKEEVKENAKDEEIKKEDAKKEETDTNK